MYTLHEVKLIPIVWGVSANSDGSFTMVFSLFQFFNSLGKIFPYKLTFLLQECIPVGCIPSTAVAVLMVFAWGGRCLHTGGVCLGGVCPGGCLPTGCLPREGVCLGDVFPEGYLLGGVCLGAVHP